MARSGLTPRPSSSKLHRRRRLLSTYATASRKLSHGDPLPSSSSVAAERSDLSAEKSNLSAERSNLSARKLGAMLWQLQISSPEFVHGDNQSSSESSKISAAMEKATKWDDLRSSDRYRPIEDQGSSRRLHAELDEARSRVSELEAERHDLIKKLDRAINKITVIDDMRDALAREKKARRRLEAENTKLADDLAEAELTARRRLQEIDRERKGRELAEELCDELAREMEDDKAELEALRRRLAAARDEAEDERKMLQLAEVWREERVQMKLVDARLALEEKWAVLVELEALIRENGVRDETAKALREVAGAAVAAAVKEIGEFKYQPPPDDVFDVVKEIQHGEDSGWETTSGSQPPSINGSTDWDCGGGGKSGSGVTEDTEEWPASATAETGKARGEEKKQSLKAKLLEARLDSKKFMLRHALRQKA